MAEEAATSLQQRQYLQPSHHFNHICCNWNPAVDSLKQLFHIRRTDEEAASLLHHQNLRQPHRLINMGWDSHETEVACEQSRNALNDHHQRSHLMNDPTGKHLFLISMQEIQATTYQSYGDATVRRERAWGSNDIMVNLSGDTTLGQSMAYLRYAANFRGGAVHLLHLKVLTRDEQSAWLDALSLAVDTNEAPKSLLISKCDLNIYNVLSALKEFKGLSHLSLQWMRINDPCVEVLRGFNSLTSLHLQSIDVSGNFVAELAELRPAHSPLAASLQRLHIHSTSIDWGRSSGFLRNWPKLQELSLSSYDDMREEELINFMTHLAPPSASASPLQLYSLDMQRHSVDSPHLRYSSAELSQSAVSEVVYALARSGLPFFQHPKMNPAIQAQLWSNQRNRILRSGWEQMPATSMPLLICGDPFSGKTLTLKHLHQTA